MQRPVATVNRRFDLIFGTGIVPSVVIVLNLDYSLALRFSYLKSDFCIDQIFGNTELIVL